MLIQISSGKMFRTFITTVLSSFFFLSHSYGRELITNGSFEEYSSMPTEQGQIRNAIGWDDVVESSDYMNSGYSCWTSNVGGAYAGKGYAGFASYSDAEGSSEAIGQQLRISPLIPGEKYIIRLYSKKSTGSYAEVCGGISLYGFGSPPALDVTSAHVSNYPGAKLLWTSDVLNNETWKLFKGSFKTDTTINYIVLSMGKWPNCGEYAFVDSISIKTGQFDSEMGMNWNYSDHSSLSKDHSTVIRSEIVVEDYCGEHYFLVWSSGGEMETENIFQLSCSAAGRREDA
jgi:hypothetical protein